MLSNEWGPKTGPPLPGAILLSGRRQEPSREENAPFPAEPVLFCRYTDVCSLQSTECLAPLTDIKYA